MRRPHLVLFVLVSSIGAPPARAQDPVAVNPTIAKVEFENDRIRVEASRNLVDAVLAGGARRYVQESIAFLYGDHGGDCGHDCPRRPADHTGDLW